MTIYVVLGKLKEVLDDDFSEVLKAFTLFENAEKFYKDQFDKEDNPYYEVWWQQTELEM